MRFMLAPRSAKAKNSSILEKSHGMRNLLGSLSFSGGNASFIASVSRSTTRGGEEEVIGIVGPLYAFPLRVVIPFKSSFGLVMVLLRRVLEPEDEMSQLAVEESGLAEPKLGNPGFDKPVLDKLEVGFDHD
nr:hypothetical protein [Tanacetum cinerariifolium]